MTGVNVPLDDEENEIVELFMPVCNEKTKPKAIKKLIMKAKELPCIKKLIEAKKEYNKK